MRSCQAGTRRALIAVVALGLVWIPTSSSSTAVGTTAGEETRLRIVFDGDAAPGTALTAGASITDTSGWANNGVVISAAGGSIDVVVDAVGVVADFPAECQSAPCANAMVQVPDHPSLDPLTADFEWGARILMQPDETDDGENVVQKGITDEPGGQWKLQVDKADGRPSCVVSGRSPGESADRRVVLTSSVGVADGVWHHVVCRRTAAAGVEIVIDGVVTGVAPMPVVNLDSDAVVTIGAKWVTPSENDQFHGLVDDIFMTTRVVRVESMTAAAVANQPAQRVFNTSAP